MTTHNQIYLLILLIISLIALLRWPSWPIVVGYSLFWIIWPYNFAIIGGRLERIVASLGLIGIIILLQQKKEKIPAFPPQVNIGIYILLISYFSSWILHPSIPDSESYVISLFARILFFYIVFVHLRNINSLKYALILYVLARILLAILIFYFSIKYGFGFRRDYGKHSSFYQLFGRFGESLLIAGNSNTIPAIILLGIFSQSKSSNRTIIFISVLFLFWMSFVTEYRREILITIPLILLFLIIKKEWKLRKIATYMIIFWSVLFLYIIIPSTVFQQRWKKETQVVIAGKETRMISNKAGLEVFSKSPILGNGPNSYQTAISYLLGNDSNRWSKNPYNAFIWIMVESGLLGLLGLSLIIYGVYREAVQAYRQYKGNSVEHLILKLAPVFILQIIIWFSFGCAWDASIPWFLMGMILAAARVASESPKKNEQTDVRNLRLDRRPA